MSARALTLMCVAVSAFAGPGLARDDGDVERARARLRAILDNASSSGVVTLKSAPADAAGGGAPQEPPDSAPEGAPASTALAPVAAAAAPPDCTLEEDLLAPQASPQDAAAEISALRSDASAPEAAYRLAVAYLRVGFIEEAAAIAAHEHADPRMASVAAVAQTLGGREAGAVETLTGAATCGPVHRAILAAARAEAARGTPIILEPDELSALAALPRELAFLMSERLAFAAHAGGDATLAGRLADLARASAAGAPSDRLLLIEADQNLPESERRIAALAGAPGDLQSEAIAVQAAQASDDEASRSALIADLEIAAHFAATPDRRLHAAKKAADLHVERGALIAAVATLAKLKAADGEAAALARDAAASIVLQGLGDDEATAHVAAAAYAKHGAFIEASAAHDSIRRDAIARLAQIGALELIEELPGGDALKSEALAGAALRRGDNARALATARAEPKSAHAREIAVSALLAEDDDAGALAAARGGDAALLARTAFRLGKFTEAASAFSAAPGADHAVLVALSALGAGAPSPPAAAIEAARSDPRAAAAVSLFRAPPPVALDALARVGAFAKSVAAESAFMRAEAKS